MFERVKLFRPSRNVHKLNHEVRTTLDIGVVKPSMWLDCVPGDSIQFGQVATVELQPLATPVKGLLFLESCAFFVPYDILKMGTELPLTQILMYAAKNEDVQEPIPEIPKWSFDLTDVDSNGILNETKVGKLFETFGFQSNLPDFSDNLKPLAYLQRAYNMIYNEYIRDESIDSEVSLDSNDLQTVCYKKDYFTSMLNSPQAGNAPTLKLGGIAKAKWSNDVLNEIVGLLTNYTKVTTAGGGSPATHQEIVSGTDLKIKGSSLSSSLGNTNATSTSGTSSNTDSKLGIKVNQDLLDLLNDNTLEMSNIITFNINDLRLLNKLQIWLERNAIAGTRTKEFLLANYGIAPSDETLQRPVFLGRLRTPVQIASNQSTVATTGIPQGTKTGNGVGQNSVLFKKWTVKEPGCIMVLSWLRPQASYTQGVSREWIKNTVYDFYNPIFQSLGQQPIQKGELFISGTDATDEAVIGFQDPYCFMKTKQDVTTGYLRAGESLQYWSLQRNFASAPTLSTQFLHVDPSDYANYFALTSQPQSVVTFTNVIKGIRPIHKYNVATL